MKLVKSDEIEQAEGSANVLLTVESDNTYNDYTTEVHCGYSGYSKKQEILLEKVGANWSIPAEVFLQGGNISFSIGLTKGNTTEKTNAVDYYIKPAPTGTVILPAEITWQKYVEDYLNEVTDTNIPELQKKIADANDTLDDIETLLEEYEGTLELTEQVDKNTDEIGQARVSFADGKEQDTLNERLNEDFAEVEDC